jgi:hypothetical protein
VNGRGAVVLGAIPPEYRVMGAKRSYCPFCSSTVQSPYKKNGEPQKARRYFAIEGGDYCGEVLP